MTLILARKLTCHRYLKKKKKDFHTHTISLDYDFWEETADCFPISSFFIA